MAGEEPVILPVGTEVSAKYRGAFCEAKVKKIVKCVKCKVTISDPRAQIVVTDEDVKGLLKTGAKIEVKHPDTSLYVEATFNKLTDCSMYTVVFDDGDENTLRRTQLCLKGEKHFVKSETLDQLPLTHPEHFGTPVMKSYKGTKRRRANTGVTNIGLSDSDSESEASECNSPRKRIYKGRNQEMVGQVLCMEIDDRKKTTWVPVLIIIPSASEFELKTRDHLLVKSFKDSRLHTVSRKDTKEFTRDMAIKNEDKTLKQAMEKALAYFDSRDLPSNWDREELLGQYSEEEDESDTSDDEPSEEKDHFVAQLYKFMDDRDTPINKAPAIGSRDLNLYRLFKLVRNLGGYNKVTNLMKWKMIYSKMNLPPSGNAYNQIKGAYKKYLHAYEDFYRKLGSTMGNRPGRTRHSSGRSLLSFREREVAQPKSPRTAEKKREERQERQDDEKIDDEKKMDEKKHDKSFIMGKGEDSDKKDLEVISTRKSEDRKSLLKDDTEAETDSPRKRRSRADKKVEADKIKEDEKITTKRVTREEMAKMKDDIKVKDEQERSRRSTSKKTDDSEDKDEAVQVRRSVPLRKKKIEEKEELKKKVPEEPPISDGGPDDDSEEGDEDDEPAPPPPKEEMKKDARRHRELALGTKLKVRYGRGRNQKIYEAKVVEVEQEASSIHYLVHYAGWNNRYDEWVMRDRIVAVVSEGTDSDSKKINIIKKLVSSKVQPGNVKKLKRPSSSCPSPTPKPSEAKQSAKNKPSSQTVTPTHKPRPTRSSGPELSLSLLPTRRSRRGSGIGDNASDLQSHVSGSESDDDESTSDDKKGDTDDTDSSKTKSDKSTDTKSKSKAISKIVKNEKETPPISESDSEICESEKDIPVVKNKSDTRGQARVKADSKAQPSRTTSDEDMILDPPRKIPTKSTPTRISKKSEESAPLPSNPSATIIISDEALGDCTELENKASELLGKDEDAQSDDAILKGIDMGDILVYPDSDMSIAPPKPKTSKDTTRGKRRKSTDSVDDVSRQDSLDTVAYGYDIQDAVQNILDQLDEGDDDSDDLSFLTPTKDTKVLFQEDGEKKDEHKTKKDRKADKEKVKEKIKTKTAKKIDKVPPEDIKQEPKESDTEKEKKLEGEKKKKIKKKKVKKKIDGKDCEKDGKSTDVSMSEDPKMTISKIESESNTVCPATPQMPVDEVINSPPQLAAVTPSKDRETKSDQKGIEMSPLPPKLLAERLDLPNLPNNRSTTQEHAADIHVLPSSAVVELTTATAFTRLPNIIQTPPASLVESLPSTSTSSSSVAFAPSLSSSASSLAVTSLQSPPTPQAATSSTSTSTVLASAQSSISTSQPITTAASAIESVPLLSPPRQATVTLFDNTPPETPEGSPEAPPVSDVTKSPAHTSMDTFVSSNTIPTVSTRCLSLSPPRPEPATVSALKVPSAPTEQPLSVVLPLGGESPNACDTSTISNGSEGSNGNMPSSEDSTEGSTVMPTIIGNKRKIVEDNLQPPKKRKRSSKRAANTDKGKSTPKHTMSDSDEAAESGSVSPKHPDIASPPAASSKNTPSKNKSVLPNQSPTASGSSNSPGRDDNNATRPSKYNFNLEEGNYLEGDQRIIFIMEKLTEIRKIYMSLKAEVACIDRRRKRAKRREKEGTALTLASLANS